MDAGIAAKGSNASPAKVEAAFEQLNRDDALMAHALKVARQAIENRVRQSLPRGASYPVDKSLTLNSIPDNIING